MNKTSSTSPCDICSRLLGKDPATAAPPGPCVPLPGSASRIPDCLRYMIPDILSEGLMVAMAASDDWRIVFANQRFAQMCNTSAEDLMGRAISELYSREDYVRLRRHISDGSKGGHHRFEFFLPQSEGGVLPAMFGLRRIPLADGPTFAVFCVTDISQLKEAQRAVEERQAMIEADLAVAERVQRSLFPRYLMVEGIEVVTTYRPRLAIGGDYAWISVHEGRALHAVVGDVTGHGIAASLIANRLAAECAHYATADKPPADLLVAVNRASLSLMGEPGTFCTVAAVRVNLRDREMCYSGAGHPPAFLARLSGAVQPLYSQHRILGVLDDIGPPGAGVCWAIEKGDTLVMYTDGLPESRNPQGEQFGYHQLREVIREAIGANATEMGEHIMGRVDTFRGGPAEDDLTLVIISAVDL